MLVTIEAYDGRQVMIRTETVDWGQDVEAGEEFYIFDKNRIVPEFAFSVLRIRDSARGYLWCRKSISEVMRQIQLAEEVA